MENITKIPGGFFILNLDTTYLYENNFEILGDDQVHIWTNQGIIYLNLSCTIENQSFTDINVFVNFLIN
jgi:hypothetical protein